MIQRRFGRAARGSLPDSLLALAATLHDATGPDDLLSRLTSGLAARDVACALLSQAEGSQDFQLERSTLPFAPEVWGRPLRLPRLALALTRGRPLSYEDTEGAFSESPGNGSHGPLFTAPTPGRLVAAPLRYAGRPAVLCLASRELDERDAAAVWALAVQLGAASNAGRPAAAQPAQPAARDDLPFFHELTRRLSYSLAEDDIVRAAVEVLAPAIGLQLAVAVSCRGDEDITTVFGARELPPATAGEAASGALDAFVRLTGGRHRACSRPAPRGVQLSGAQAPDGRPESALDAPLVIEGDIVGLLRIASPQRDAFDAATERSFYTVANQISLALERVAAQRTAERAQLTSLAESLNDGIVLVDAELRITSLNAAARDLLALILDERIEQGATLDGTALGVLARDALSNGRATALREIAHEPGPSGRRYIEAMAAPLAGSQEGSAAVLVLRDVTEERLMQERLLQSEKMVSVGQLVSGVAHELNNPLTGIMGFAQLLLGRELDERTERDIETIYTEAERAAKIVQNLLSFARRKRAEKELSNLNVLVERVLELRTYDLRVKNIELDLDLDPKLPETMVDANQVQQVLFNVIINAEQAMITANGRGKLRVRSRAKDGTIRLSFQDDGPGMEPETLRRIFDPFFTTKETGEGTGLGLTISYGIIDEHGGRIWAESQPGRGTTFIIELPVVAEGPGRPVRPAEEPESRPTGASILVVDDEESIQRLLGSILEMDGHRVDTAPNGTEALKRIERNRYDVIITDIKMPDMDGRELYKRLRQMDASLAARTVFITGDTVSPDTRTFLEDVPNPCLAKPFRVREVRETIGRILAGR